MVKVSNLIDSRLTVFVTAKQQIELSTQGLNTKRGTQEFVSSILSWV